MIGVDGRVTHICSDRIKIFFIIAAFLVAGLISFVFPETPSLSPILSFGKPVDQTIRGGESHLFHVSVKAGNSNSKNLPLFVKDPQKPFAHPHYWASFVLIGNWQ